MMMVFLNMSKDHFKPINKIPQNFDLRGAKKNKKIKVKIGLMYFPTSNNMQVEHSIGKI